MNELRATPKLQHAHQALWEVREACHDDYMEQRLSVAMEAVRDAQWRLRAIEREALAA